MKCPNCGYLLEPGRKKDYTRPLFAMILILSIFFFWIGFRFTGENKSLKSSIERLERKIEYYESIIDRYEKAIEKMEIPGSLKEK